MVNANKSYLGLYTSGKIGETITVQYEIRGGNGEYSDSRYRITESLNGADLIDTSYQYLQGIPSGSITHTISKGNKVRIYIEVRDKDGRVETMSVIIDVEDAK